MVQCVWILVGVVVGGGLLQGAGVRTKGGHKLQRMPCRLQLVEIAGALGIAQHPARVAAHMPEKCHAISGAQSITLCRSSPALAAAKNTELPSANDGVQYLYSVYYVMTTITTIGEQRLNRVGWPGRQRAGRAGGQARLALPPACGL